MNTKNSLLRLVCLSLGYALIGSSIASLPAQEYKFHNGFNDLVAEFGAGLENGAGIRVLQVEAPAAGAYMPNAANSEFTGKTFINGTIPPNTGALAHATTVGTYFYGTTTGMATGINNITGAEAGDFINRYTGIASGGEPLTGGFHVSNHSYIGNVTPGNPVSVKVNLLRRFDFIASRDNTVAVVGANNGRATATPEIWAHSYNSITVGLSNGNHSRGVTTDYGAGRFKPDIVVRMADSLADGSAPNRTSWATAVVSSSAAILLQRAGFDGVGNPNNGARNQVIRSLLYAGATKENALGWNWSKTETRPVDPVFGFGQLNIYNSYKILEAGEFTASTSQPASNVGLVGWDYGNFNGADALFYNFEVLAGREVTELSAALAWNVNVFDTTPDLPSFNPDHFLANLDLQLYDSSGSFLGSLLQSSLSTIDNYEHLYFDLASGGLAAGTYTFRISGDSAANFGFAWRMTAIPEPNTGLFLAAFGIGCLLRRRK